MKKPMCLECRNLIWEGFYANCINILVDDSLFEEAIELAEAKLEGKSKEEVAVIELQQDLRFEKSLANLLMATPYIVWKRKDKVKYYEHAPRTVEECPFEFRP